MLKVAAITLLTVCVALVHSVPLSKGQSNTNINKNTNTNGNYEALYNFLSGLLDTEEEEEEELIVETPVYKPPVYKPTKPYPVYPGGGDNDDEEDKYPVVTSKPPTSNYGYAPYKPTVSIHKPCRHCPAKPTPYKPYKIPYSGSHGTVNKNTNLASNTNINDDANLATEEDDSEFDFKKAAGAKQAPAAETETTN